MIFTNETIAETGGLTDTELRATPVPVSTDGLTDTELRATPVPVSGTITSTPSGTQDVNITSTISLPVTGTFFQTTQPVSLAVAPTTPVTGTFWQATQPVSGTFFQTTQPVSIATMPSTPVTGTFWQTTQPVSGPLTDTQLRATPVPVSGSVSTTPVTSTTSSVTQVTSTGSNQTLLVSNVNRIQAVLYFESGIWYVKLGATASSASLTYKVSASNTVIEIPPMYTGIIDAICTTAGKLVDVTSLNV
jgi:hypothetical protein